MLNNNKLSCPPDLTQISSTLETLIINANHLNQCIQPDTSNITLSLQSVYLGGNKLDELPSFVLRSPHLTQMSMGVNKFVNLPNLLTSHPRLLTIDLAANPFNCSCNALWLKQVRGFAICSGEGLRYSL